MAIRLFQSYFVPAPGERGRELQECLRRNLANSALDEMHLLVEPGDEAPSHPKVVPLPVAGRPTFNDLFAAVNSVARPGDLTIVANSDIYLDAASVLMANRHLQRWQAYALSRWDVAADGTAELFDIACSQDTWMFRGPIAPLDAGFHPGVPGCDNRLAYLLETGPYRVFNPARDVKTYHLHASQVRTYTTETEPVAGPYFHPPADRIYSVPAWVCSRIWARARRLAGFPEHR